MTTQPFSRYKENVMSKLSLRALVGVDQIFFRKTLQGNEYFVYINRYTPMYRGGERRQTVMSAMI